MSERKVWRYYDSDFVIAANLEEAKDCLRAEGIEPECDPGDEDDLWQQMPAAQTFGVWFKSENGAGSEVMCEPNDPGGVLIEKTFAEWADAWDVGYFCSTEF